MAFTSTSFTNILLLLVSSLLGFANSLQISYCSSQNTGQYNGANYWQFQSNGHCQDTCKYQYSYAILQGNNCWCSNYAPYDQVDVGNCNVNCPGFPSEKCGNEAEGLYGYYVLDIQPSGTLGAPSFSASTTLLTNSQQTTSWTPTPSTIITTVQGSIQTVTVTPTIPPSSEQTSTVNQVPDPFWSSTAKVAGTFTVVAIVLLLLLAGTAFFFWRRWRSNDSVAIRSISDHDGHSTTGTFFGTAADKRHSKLGFNSTGTGGGRAGNRTPTLPTPVSMSRRASAPMVHDQRLNPNALYAMGQDNGSHVSLGSFQDDRDYSRPVLHVRNPDST